MNSIIANKCVFFKLKLFPYNNNIKLHFQSLFINFLYIFNNVNDQSFVSLKKIRSYLQFIYAFATVFTVQYKLSRDFTLSIVCDQPIVLSVMESSYFFNHRWDWNDVNIHFMRYFKLQNMSMYTYFYKKNVYMLW